MADNIQVTEGSGKTVATDDVAGVQYQIVKLAIGGDGAASLADESHPIPARDAPASTSAVTRVAASASNGTLLSANSARLSAILYNDSSAVAFVKLGATASSTSKTFAMGAGDLVAIRSYTGRIDAVWSSATGAMDVTELSA